MSSSILNEEPANLGTSSVNGQLMITTAGRLKYGLEVKREAADKEAVDVCVRM